MKRFLKNLILSLSIILLISSCGWIIGVQNNGGNTDGIVLGAPAMKNSYVMTASEYQLDSICVADTLPDPAKWLGVNFKDYETGEQVMKRMHIKHWGKTEIVYIIIGTKEPYNITRRITE